MPDAYSQRDPAPGTWSDAFAALPADIPPGDGWSRLSARLDARRGPSFAWPRRAYASFPAMAIGSGGSRRLAIAAALVAAVALPWALRDRLAPPAEQAAPTVAAAAGSQAQPSLEQLYAESARLEALLQYARDDRVSSASAAALSSEMDARVATIDRALMQPGLSPEQQLWLWRNRVDALRSQAGFESTRRWLAANGERYDGAVARVD